MRFQMSEDIRAAIEKNIPAEAGNLLQERLKEADDLEKRAADLAVEVADLSGENSEYEKRLRGTMQREEALASDERKLEVVGMALEARERQIEMDEAVAKVKAESIQAQLDHSKWVMQLVFGNRIIRSNVQASVPVASGERVEVNYSTTPQTETVIDDGETLQGTNTTTETEEA